MLRQIISLLWNNRRHNLWIMLELVAIAVVSWSVIDPLFVLKYNQSILDGFEAEGLYRLELDRNVDDTVSVPQEDYNRIMHALRHHKDIESATCVLRGAYPGSPGNNMNVVFLDTVQVRTTFIPFFPHSQFFQTWRFRSAKDGTWESLERLDVPEGGVILSEDANLLLGRGKDLTGRSIYYSTDSTEIPVFGVMKPIKMRNCMQPYLVRMVAEGSEEQIPEWAFSRSIRIFFRTKAGVSENRFVDEFLTWADDNLTSGSLIYNQLTPFHEVRRESDLTEGATNEIRTRYLLAAFFMINLLLAVSGTFWLNTRTREEEMGIRRSYGASSASIRRMLIGEGFVLTTVAVAVGCFIYFHWVYYEGYYTIDDGVPVYGDLYLTNHFWQHFFAVSFIVYVVMLFVTWLGVYIPARTISLIPPVQALRDE